MSRKESKFYVTNYIDPRTILIPRAMKTHTQILYKQDKLEGKRYLQRL